KPKSSSKALTMPCQKSATLNSEFFFLLAGNGVKKGLTESVRTETADHGLGLRRDHKIGKSLSARCIDSRTVSGVDFHHRINIKEHPVAFDENRQPQRFS